MEELAMIVGTALVGATCICIGILCMIVVCLAFDMFAEIFKKRRKDDGAEN